VTNKDNGHHGPVKPADPSLPSPDLSPENIAAQVVVVMTKDGRYAMMYPADIKKTPNLPLALTLLAQGVQMVGNMLAEQQPKEPSRIVLAPGLPPRVDLRGRAGG
jgi:hypothetical protein